LNSEHFSRKRIERKSDKDASPPAEMGIIIHHRVLKWSSTSGWQIRHPLAIERGSEMRTKKKDIVVLHAQAAVELSISMRL